MNDSEARMKSWTTYLWEVGWSLAMLGIMALLAFLEFFMRPNAGLFERSAVVILVVLGLAFSLWILVRSTVSFHAATRDSKR